MADKDKVQELTRKFDEVVELARKLDEVQEVAQKFDEVIELARKLNEAQELARKLDDWAEKLPEEQKKLLRWLLSRGTYVEKRVDGQRIEGTTTHVVTNDIKQAVKDALGPLVRANLPESMDGWPRSYPNWPRMGDWPRDGYWALGIGCPPNLDKMLPKGPKIPI